MTVISKSNNDVSPFLPHLNLEESLTADEIASYLKIGRETLGLNVEEMAEELGINKNTYCKYENGRYPRNVEILLATMQYALKKHFRDLRARGDFVLRDYLGDLDTLEKTYILKEHAKGKNVVQIGLSLSLEEHIVRDYLSSQDIEPLEFYID